MFFRRFLPVFGLVLSLVMPALWFPPDAFCRGGGGCIEEGARILLPGGGGNVETLRPGDTVALEARGAAVVRAAFRVQPDEFVQLRWEGGCLRLTPEHPVAVAPGVFRMAGLLKPGDRVLARDPRSGVTRPAPLLEAGRVKTGRAAYNLLVGTAGCYFAENLLVHNKGCFLPDTPVTLEDGSRVPISTLKPGQRVLAFETDGTITASAVRDVLTAEEPGHLVVTTDRAELRVTPSHPFYVGGGEFRTLDTLKTGDTLYAWNGAAWSAQKILGIRAVPGRVTVYNLQTEEPHTYFAAGVAVHNKGGGGGCFLAGTPVPLEDGSNAAIETLKPGQRVLAFTPDGSVTASAVLELLTVEAEEYLEIKSGGVPLQVTAEHPFYMGGGEYRAAGKLKPGDALQTFAEGCWRERKIESVRRVPGKVTVYNLRTEEPHTFFAAGVAVHNKGGSSGGSHSSSGSSHSSGGYYGGSYHSSSSRASDAGAWIIFGVLFGVIILIIVLAIVFNNSTPSKLDENLDFVYDRKDMEEKIQKTLKLLQFLARQDTSMQLDTLREHIVETFNKLQQCWSARAYEPMRPLMADDLYERHCQQIEGMKRAGEINIIANDTIEAVDVVHIHYTHKPNDRFIVASIIAEAQDYYVSDKDGEFLRGDGAPARFQEFWTFRFQDGKWLLAEIEQSRESAVLKQENFFEQFTDAQIENIYGGKVEMNGPAGPWLEKEVDRKATEIERMLNFLVQTDKAWNRQAMITRVRKTFTNVYMAREMGELDDETRGMLFPDVAEALAADISASAEKGLVFQFRNFCVRKVELINIRNRDDNSLDEFDARVSAHAMRTLERNGQIELQEEYVTPFEEYWTFGRHEGEWKLKELLPPGQGWKSANAENVDEDSSREQLKWYYTKKRA